MSRTPAGRVLTEAAVIVCSILSAFSIDAWWEERQEDRRLLAALMNVREELVANSAELDLVAFRHRDIYESGVRVLEVAVGDVPPDTAFSRRAKWVLGGEMWLDVATEALDQVLVSAEGTSSLEPSLRTQLASYRSGLDQVWQQETMVRELVRGELTREISRRYDLLVLGTGSRAEGLLALAESHAPADLVGYISDIVRDPIIRNLVTARTGREFQAMTRIERLQDLHESLLRALPKGGNAPLP